MDSLLRLTSVSLSTALVCLTATASANELTWTGAGDGTSFGDAGNWDGTPTGGSLNLGALVDDFVIDDASACVGCPGGVSQLTWADTNVGSFTMTSGTLSGAAGLRYTTVNMTGGELSRQFLLSSNVLLSGDATLVLRGGGNSVNLTTVALDSTDATLHFTAETPDAARSEHLSKITCLGLAAIEGLNCVVESDGASGSTVRAVEISYTPATLTWTGAGDGTSFADELNWDGASTLGGIDIQFLIDVYSINSGDVGGTGVSDLDFLLEGGLEMTGGVLRQDTANGAQGLNGGYVTVSGGELQRQFLAATMVSLSGAGAIVLNGGADPLPFGATLDISGTNCLVTFLQETPADFLAEHLGKVTVAGELAVEGENLLVSALGKTSCTISAIESAGCIADLNDNGTVDGADLTFLLGAWAETDSAADLDGSGLVDGADLTVLLGAWGSCAG